MKTTIFASNAISSNAPVILPLPTVLLGSRFGEESVKWADLVLWSPKFFGVKPDTILKGGSIAAYPMGDINASIPTLQPVHYRPMFTVALVKTIHQTSITFVSKIAFDNNIQHKLGFQK